MERGPAIDSAVTPMAPERWEQVKELYVAALAQEPERRSAFLAEACPKDSTLRSEVESLLHANEEAGSFLASTAIKAFVNDDESGSRVKQRIGSYQLIEKVGHGGMGTVYLAVRADGLFRKRVAIKVIKRGLDTESILRRFKNERQILASLDHPNIARLLDGGTTEDGLPYFVMEYVEGQPLLEHCDTHKLPTVERLKLFRTICSAVHYAHQNLVVHRDLKSKNILVTADGVPKLLDFGIAKLLKPELAAQTVELTAPAIRLMTPEYASPEQFRGESITAASDIYTLGVLLYELLTGHHPYRLKSRFDERLAQVVCEEEPEKPSIVIRRVESRPASEQSGPTTLTPEFVSKTRDGSAEQLRRRLKGDLDNIVLKAMHKVPKSRYASVEQLSEDIRRHLEGLPIIARKTALSYRSVKFIRRHKSGVVTALLIVLACAGAATTVWQTRVALKSAVVLPFVNTTADPNAEYLSDGITDSIINSLSQLPQLRVMARATSFRFKGREINPQKIGRELGVDAVVTGTAVQRGDALMIQVELVKTADGTQLWGDHYHRSLAEVFAMQDEIARAIAEKLRVKLTDEEQRRVARRYTDNQMAYQAYLKGRYFWNKRTKDGIKKSIEYFEKAIDIDPNYALAYAGIADSYAVLPGYGWMEDKIAVPRAEAAARRALEIDATLSGPRAALGWIKFFHHWDLPAAEQEFIRALELNPNDATAHHWYSLYLAARGRLDEAVSHMQSALRLDPLSPIINNNLGRILFYARRYTEAIDQSQKALDLEPNFYAAHYFLARAYTERKMYPEAIAEWGKAAQEWGEVVDPPVFDHRAYILARSGDKRDAVLAIDAVKKLVHSERVGLRIAFLYTALGEEEQALTWLEKAYEEHDGWLIFLRVDPEYDPLRSHARYNDLLRRLKLDR